MTLSSLVSSLDRPVALHVLLQALPDLAPCVFLDSARPHPVTGRWSLLGIEPWLRLEAKGDAIRVQTTASTTVRRGDPLEALAEITRRYRIPTDGKAHTRAVGLMGYLGYEAKNWIESLPPPKPEATGLPDLLFFAMAGVLLVDHAEGRTWIVSVVDPHCDPALARKQAADRLERLHALAASDSNPIDPGAFWSSAPAPTFSRETFEDKVSQALDFIRAGDVFQVNLAQRFTGTWSGDPRRLYRALREVNPSPFAAYVRDGARAVASCSPERLVRAQDGRVDTRPIAGTRPRGASADDDAMRSLDLLLSEKERAEHIMLVDLMRNDLGRVSAAGSMGVDELMAIETYSHVLHIVSGISGRLKPGIEPVDIIRAVFPGGTITGCPKVRCMEILHALEPVARGLYTGSLGTIGFDGALDLNIAIRTIALNQGKWSLHAGAGIVADSNPGREYEETLAKAHALFLALERAAESTHEPAQPRFS